MSAEIGKVVKLHMKDKWSWFYIPWIILLSSFLVNVLIAALIDLGGDEMTTGGMMSIFIYMFVAGVITLAQTFPFALGFSVRRKDYLLGTGAMAAIVSAFIALVLVLLGVVEQELTGGWGVSLNFFRSPSMESFNLAVQFLLYFLAIFHLFTFGFVISSIHRRFGRNGMYVFFITLFVVVTLFVYMAHYQGWWMELYEWMTSLTSFEFMNGLCVYLAVLSGLYAWITYLFIRRAAV